MTTFKIQSMTGFGRAQRESQRGQFTVEIRTVNNRFQDVSLSLPRELNLLENALRAQLKQEIPRGKVECRVLYVAGAQEQPRVRINYDLARQYIEQMAPLREMGAASEVSLEALTRLPGVIELLPAELDEQALWAELSAVVTLAAQALRAEREREGGALAQQMVEQNDQLRQLVAQIDACRGEVVERFRQKLQTRLAELELETKTPLEPGRLESEVALYADRCDITEEIVRLGVHLDRFEAVMTAPQEASVGKGLDFLVQEFNREINTICSKSRDTSVTGAALEMKNIVERIREQVQNIQ